MSSQSLATIDIPTLRRGDQGNAVKFLQLLLNNFHGYSIQVDGIFGQQTENSIRDFQSSHNLPLTGIVYYVTWQALVQGD